MYIKDINKNTIFVKKYNVFKNTFIVEEKEIEGILTISVTKDPLKAKLYTAVEVYKETYNNLDEDAKEALAKTYATGDYRQNILTKIVNLNFKVIMLDNVNYYYSDDIKDEQELLDRLGLDTLVKPIVTTVVQEAK